MASQCPKWWTKKHSKGEKKSSSFKLQKSMNNQISGLRYLILNLVFIHHRKGKLNGEKIKNNFKKPCDWQSETSFFFLILPKP